MLSIIFRALSCFFTYLFANKISEHVLARLDFAKKQNRKLSLEDILRDRVLCPLVFIAAGIVVSCATSPWILPVCIPVAYIFARRAPSILDARKARAVRSACDEQLDVMADIVAMGVRSGLSFDAALELYCSKFDNDLAQNLYRARLEWTSGLASRQQALSGLATQIDSKALKRFSETSLQAIHYGSPLADMLARFSNDIRQRRRSAVERQIAKAPIKMIIPTGTCILPAMLILVMGPVLLQFVQTGY